VIAGVIVGAAQLGDGRTTQSNVPVEVKLPAGAKVTAIAAGCHHSQAVTSTGQVLAWGDNARGELGNGKTTSSDVPVRVKLPAGTKVTAIAAGCSQSLALTSTGRVLAWGDDAYGELGDGKTTQSDVPVEVKLPAATKVTAISGGAHHSLALISTGQVLAWGENGGQLGDGNTTQRDVPVKVRLP
jgi:alpha-tubulin suppressor-like RCC1 family protein